MIAYAAEIQTAPATTGGAPTAGLTPALYQELRRIASRHLVRERPNHTLQPTALVHEAYLKLGREAEKQFQDEGHLLAVASRAMRQILVDYARARGTKKRVAGLAREEAETALAECAADTPDLAEVIEVDEALASLEAENPRLARLVEMRYFCGMTAEESAAALGLSVHTVRHDLRFAQAWLRKKLRTV